MVIDTLNDLFIDLFFDVINSEKHLAGALPGRIAAAASSELRNFLKTHLTQTKKQITRLEKISGNFIELNAHAENCEGMKGLNKESAAFMKKTRSGSIMDAVLITTLQKEKHYEIAAYNALCSLALKLGYNEEAQFLEDMLEEEKRVDTNLSIMARNFINEKALTIKRAA